MTKDLQFWARSVPYRTTYEKVEAIQEIKKDKESWLEKNKHLEFVEEQWVDREAVGCFLATIGFKMAVRERE